MYQYLIKFDKMIRQSEIQTMV